MSNRQQARVRSEILRVQAGLQEANDDEEIDEDIPHNKKLTPVFVFSSESDSDTESKVSSLDEAEIKFPKSDTINLVPANNTILTDMTNKKNRNRKITEKTALEHNFDEDALLDTLIEQNQSLLLLDTENMNNSSAKIPASEMCFQFNIDPKGLDMEAAARVRFGNTFREGPAERLGGPVRGQRRGVTRSNRHANRRWIFGSPKDDWVRPPSFIGGGMGMLRISDEFSTEAGTNKKNNKATRISSNQNVYFSVFQFEFSKEYEKIRDLYQIAVESGDANYLVMFLANRPYYAPGFFDLAMIFAHSGHLDKAMDLLRRCLYCHECAMLEAFKPYTGQCRLDALHPCNTTFFKAMVKYSQVCSIQGFHSLAADTMRIVLSLNPTDDQALALLSLDYYLLMANKFDVLLQMTNYYNWGTASSSTEVSSVGSAESGEEEQRHQQQQKKKPWDGSYIFEAFEENGVVSRFGVEQLPNWWYSLALALFLKSSDEATKEKFHSSDPAAAASKEKRSEDLLKEATERLREAVRQWPFVAAALLNKLSPGTVSSERNDWLEACSKVLPSDGYLQVVCNCYIERTANSLWSRAEVLQLLRSTVLDCFHGTASVVIADDIDAMTNRLLALSHQKSPLHKYSKADMDDFLEEFPRLPDGVNPVDPDLMDPRVLAGGAKFENFDKHLLAMKDHFRLRDRRQGLVDSFLQRQKNSFLSFSWMVDFSLPLLQLFFVTLFPWTLVPAIKRR